MIILQEFNTLAYFFKSRTISLEGGCQVYRFSQVHNRNLYILRAVTGTYMVLGKTYQNKYKSAGERKIGNYLDNQQIAYTYEKPLAVVHGGKTKIWYPDFHLDDYHILLEYLGMNGNPQNAKINDYKRRVYKDNKLEVIEIYPADFMRNWQRIIDQAIYDTLERRIRGYIAKTRISRDMSYMNKPYDMKF